MRSKLRIFCLGFIILVLGTTSAWGEDISEIARAQQLYNKNEFKAVAEIYEREMASGKINGHRYFNLGNTYFRVGDLPRAILNFAKAQIYLPRDEDVAANLEYVLNQTQNGLDARLTSSLDSILFWSGDFNLKEHLLALLFLNLLFWASLATGLHLRSPASQTTRRILLVLLILAVISTGFRWHRETDTSLGVVRSTQAGVHSGWNETTTVLFQLHQGTLVSLVQAKEGWYELELTDGQKGWIPQGDIVR